MSATIRKATKEDAKSLVDVLRTSFAEFAGLFDPPSGALSETVHTVHEKLENSTCFVAELDRQIVACVFCRPDEGDFYLYRLGVLPNWRGQGIGIALIQKVEQMGKKLNFPRIRLGTRLALPRNIEYYKRLGYEHIGNGINNITGQPFYAVMVKPLVPEDQ